MSKFFFNAISQRISTYVWASLLFNCFALKMFIDVGNYNICPPLFFFHFIASLLITLALSMPTPSFQTYIRSCLHALTVWPSFGLICLHGTISVLHLITYAVFLMSMILSTQFILKAFKSARPPLFYALITLFFLWGTNLVIESIDIMYHMLAPLTMSYHYSLVTEGILHVSSIIYIFALPLAFYGISDEKRA